LRLCGAAGGHGLHRSVGSRSPEIRADRKNEVKPAAEADRRECSRQRMGNNDQNELSLARSIRLGRCSKNNNASEEERKREAARLPPGEFLFELCLKSDEF